MTLQLPASTKLNRFPFTLSDLQYWILVYKDGSTTKFVYQDPKFEPRQVGSHSTVSPYQGPYTGGQTTSLSRFCKHSPHPKEPLYVSKDGKWTISVADMSGIQAVADEFDLVIDCGNVLEVTEHKDIPLRDISRWSADPILDGDVPFLKKLQKYVLVNEKTIYIPKKPKYKLLQIDWMDRQAPDLKPEFWPELYKHLEGNVVVNCQGGHGRSGSLAVLMMMMDSDYTPLDAIVHLRANHCPRAIESIAQHDYINSIAKFLGRNENAEDAYDIKDYKEAWEKMDNETSQREKLRRENKGE